MQKSVEALEEEIEDLQDQLAIAKKRIVELELIVQNQLAAASTL